MKGNHLLYTSSMEMLNAHRQMALLFIIIPVITLHTPHILMVQKYGSFQMAKWRSIIPTGVSILPFLMVL
jgi:hypothetical protein